jgi:hypothetical protein
MIRTLSAHHQHTQVKQALSLTVPIPSAGHSWLLLIIPALKWITQGIFIAAQVAAQIAEEKNVITNGK